MDDLAPRSATALYCMEEASQEPAALWHWKHFNMYIANRYFSSLQCPRLCFLLYHLSP